MLPHILLIDDDVSNLEMMCSALLKESRYFVTAVEGPLNDLGEIERLQPSLILLDLMMQKQQEGWTLLQKLKLHRSTKDIPLIACTIPLTELKELEPVLLQKGIPILYKPFEANELLRIIQQALSSSTWTHKS